MKTQTVTRLTQLAAVIGLSIAPAMAMTMTYDSSVATLYEFVDLKLDGNAVYMYAGQIGVRFDSNLTALVFCADPFTALRTDAVEVAPVSTTDFPNGARLAFMFNTFAPSFTQGWQAAAFQLAAWDVVADNGNGFSTGRVQSSASTNAQILAFAETILSTSLNQSGTGATFYTPTPDARYSQTLFNATDSTVPEPSTYLLMGAGLLALGEIRRRRN